MTTLNTSRPTRGGFIANPAFVPSLPLPTSYSSRLRGQAIVGATGLRLTQMTGGQRVGGDLPEQLFDALASFKVQTSRIAIGHLNGVDRDRLFRHLDCLLDIENWEAGDQIANNGSFNTLLRLTLFLGGKRPALGLTSTGNFIATWTADENRLTIECKPNDQIRWVMIQKIDDFKESAAGETSAYRLPEMLRPYDIAKNWFPDAIEKTSR